jgi:hypothetical protein
VDNLASRCAWAIKIIRDDKDLDKGIKDIALAKILGTDKNTLSRYRREKGLLKGEVIDNLIHHYHFHPMWLFFNEGEPFPGARQKYPGVCGPETPPQYFIDAASGAEVHSPPPHYGPGSSSSRQISDPKNFNLDEAMGRVYKVLSSNTPYALALYLNIQQFASSLDSIKELNECKERLETMQQEVDALRAQVDVLRRQVDRLSAVPDTAAVSDDSSEKMTG